MDTTKAQQIALDVALSLLRTVLRLGNAIKSNEPAIQVVLDALKLTPLYNAFLVTTNVPEIYMQEFWATVSLHHNSLRFKMNGKSHTLNVENFRDMLQIYPRLPDSKAYKEYYIVASGAVPLKEKNKVTKPAKKTKAKGLALLSKVALSEAEQIKLTTKRSKKDFPISYASDSGNGVDTQLKIPDKQEQKTYGTYEGTDGDDNDDDCYNDDDDDGKRDDHDDDSDDERLESDSDEIPDPNLTNLDHTKYEEEDVDERVCTPSDNELTDEEKLDDEETKDNKENDEVLKELYEDVNVKLEKDDAEMTDANQGVHSSNHNSEKYIITSYGDVVLLKRGRVDQDKDEDPSAGSDRGTKRSKSGKDVESSKDSRSKEKKSSRTSKDSSQSQHKSSDKRRIIAVTRLTIMKKYDYGHLEEIEVHRDDQQLYTFKEGDFKRLRLQDIEDMLLLLVQQRLTNLKSGIVYVYQTYYHSKAGGRSSISQNRRDLPKDIPLDSEEVLRDYTYFYQLSYSELIGIEKVAVCSSLQSLKTKSALSSLEPMRSSINLIRTLIHYELSDTKVIKMKMEILLEPTSNKLIVERFDTSAGNLVKKILLKWNLPEHRQDESRRDHGWFDNDDSVIVSGEYSQWRERFMNYLEEQTDGEAMINSIQNGLPNDIYSLIDSNETAKDLWYALEMQMHGSEYGEQDRKAAILYEYETFKDIKGEELLDTYLRYLQVINDLNKCGYKKDNCELNYKFLNNLQPEWKQYVSKRKEKVVVSSDSEGSSADDFSELKKITSLLEKAFNRRKFYSKPTNNNLKTSSTSQSANKKQEFVKSDDKKVEKKDDGKKRDMSKVKCYNCKKEGHFAKDYKKAKVKDYNYYKTKMLLAKKDSDEQMSCQLVEMNNNVIRLQEKILEKETKISELEGCASNKDAEIEKCLERLNECENKLHKIIQTNQTIHMIMPSKDTLYNGQKGIGFENPSYFEKAKDLRPSLYDEKVIGLGYTLMFLIHSDEALEIEKFKRARENKIEFAYDYENLNASNQTSSLKPYVPTVILEKIIIDLEDEVVSLLEKEKANLKTSESLKSKGFESSENEISESENQSENDCQVVEKECDQVENSKVVAPRMFKLSVSQSVSPISMSKTSCASKNGESKLKRKRRKRKSSKQNDKQENNDVLHANRDFVHFSDLDTFSIIRRPKQSSVIWKEKGSSNTSNVDLSSVSHSKLNKNDSHLGETSSAYVCNDAMNVSCNFRLCDSFDENNLFIFDDESVRISPVSKMPFRKKPRDSMNVRSKSNLNKSLPRIVH
nr:hypothetical protein [Tanacetum cinerariifolium]